MKRLFTFLVAIALVFALIAPCQAEIQRFKASVYKRTNANYDIGELELITSGITYKVLAINSDTAETLYADAANTAKTNPVTATVFNTQDRVDFYCDPTDATNDRYVDLMVVDTNGGFTAFVEDFDKYQRTIVIDERPNVRHHGCIWWDDADGAATDTGVAFLADTIIERVCVEVVTIDSGQVIDIETADTATGFISGQSITTAGYYCNDKPVLTVGSIETYVGTGTQIIGTLMGKAVAGTNVTGDTGVYHVWPHVVTPVGTAALANEQLYFDTDASSGFAADGYIHYWFIRVR